MKRDLVHVAQPEHKNTHHLNHSIDSTVYLTLYRSVISHHAQLPFPIFTYIHVVIHTPARYVYTDRELPPDQYGQGVMGTAGVRVNDRLPVHGLGLLHHAPLVDLIYEDAVETTAET